MSAEAYYHKRRLSQHVTGDYQIPDICETNLPPTQMAGLLPMSDGFPKFSGEDVKSKVLKYSLCQVPGGLSSWPRACEVRPVTQWQRVRGQERACRLALFVYKAASWQLATRGRYTSKGTV